MNPEPSAATPIASFLIDEAIDGVSFIHPRRKPVKPDCQSIPIRTSSLPVSTTSPSPVSSPAPATPPASPPARSTPISPLAHPATNIDTLPSPPQSSVDQSLAIKSESAIDKDHPLFAKDVLSNTVSSDPPVYGISASRLASAIDYHYSSPLPDVDTLFPWLHGLHQNNINQRAFLDPSRKEKERAFLNGGPPFSIHELSPSLLNTPNNTRGLVVVKVGQKTSRGTIIGTTYPDEILAEKPESDEFSLEDVHTDSYKDYLPEFINIDPVSGISLRNFQIQIAKWATVSDVVLYVSEESECDNLIGFARLVSQAQISFRDAHPGLPKFTTCIVEDNIQKFLIDAPHILAIPPDGVEVDENDLRLKNWDSNFLFHEGIEMSMMSSASVIGPQSENGGAVWLGNTADIEGHAQLVYDYLSEDTPDDAAKQIEQSLVSRNWTCYVRCGPHYSFPSVSMLDQLIREAQPGQDSPEEFSERTWNGTMIDFPSSAAQFYFPPSDEEMYAFVNLCKLMYLKSTSLHKGVGAGALIFCNDGYTETSLLALAYVIYSTGVSASQAWADLHCKYNRPFFSFQCDTSIIVSLQAILLKYSPAVPGSSFNENYGAEYNEEDQEYISTIESWDTCDDWFKKIDGSLPSRILSHLYLGSLVHAENPEMLAKIGVKRVISVGETLSWVKYDETAFSNDADITAHLYDAPHPGLSKVLYIDNIQDDGMDPLTDNLSKCIDFLDEAYRLGEPTLVHCRVGVSRSATVCIAEVMKRLGVGLPRAYLFVRVRRLNVIIQPHLRFMYELVKWEEKHRRSGKGWLREVDWPVLCREIAVMNRAYIPS